MRVYWQQALRISKPTPINTSRIHPPSSHVDQILELPMESIKSTEGFRYGESSHPVEVLLRLKKSSISVSHRGARRILEPPRDRLALNPARPKSQQVS